MVRSGFIVHRMQMYGKYGNPPANSPVFFTAICTTHGARQHPPPPPCLGTVHRRFRKTLESFASNYGKFCMKHWKDFQKPLGGSRGKHKRSGRTRLKPKLKIPFSLAFALTFHYICFANIGCGSANPNLKTLFSFVFALAFRYICP